MGTEERDVTEVAVMIADAIARRDVASLRALLAPDFLHRTHHGARSDLEGFLRAIAQIPGEIRFVRLEQLDIDVCAAGALATGTQHAQVVVDGQIVDDRRGFVDWFVKHGSTWRVQAAVDLPVVGSD
jgi:hypothetical protein